MYACLDPEPVVTDLGVCSSHMRTQQLLPTLPASPHGSQALADRIPEGRGGRGQPQKGPEDTAVAEMPKARLGSDGLNTWGVGAQIERWPGGMGSYGGISKNI